MISKMLGLLGPPATAPPPPPAPPTPPSAVPPLPAPPPDGLTNVTVVVAVSVASPSDRVRVIVKVPGVALVSVAFGPMGLSMTPPVVDQ